MAKYRNDLPLLSDKLFFIDGGLETTLVFHEGQDLPFFAAFVLLQDEAGQAVLRAYYEKYIKLAKTYGAGFILESATWRASADWAEKIGISPATLAELNRRAIAMLSDLRQTHESRTTPMVVSGCVGPRDDGYNAGAFMAVDEAERYHAAQIKGFSQSDADMVSAVTMTYAEEAIGITRATQAAAMPVAIAFTVETDGRLPSGQKLKDAITQVDDDTGSAPAYFMINCAHPSHFEDALAAGEPWTKRLRGIRANASTKSHAELDEAEVLDIGDPEDLGSRYKRLKANHAHLNVLGGCCGTDHRHVEQIAKAVVPERRAS